MRRIDGIVGVRGKLANLNQHSDSANPPARCALGGGVERWFVKTLSDPDAASVDLQAVTPVSIRELNGLRVSMPGTPERRGFAEEFKVLK